MRTSCTQTLSSLMLILGGAFIATGYFMIMEINFNGNKHFIKED